MNLKKNKKGIWSLIKFGYQLQELGKIVAVNTRVLWIPLTAIANLHAILIFSFVHLRFKKIVDIWGNLYRWTELSERLYHKAIQNMSYIQKNG